MKRVTPDDKPVITDGIYFDLDIDAYHEDPAISKTGLVDFAISPLYYVARRREPEPDKPAFNLGGLVHAMILEPAVVPDKYAVPPAEVLTKSGARSGKNYQAWKEQLGENVTIITKQQWIDAQKMADQILENPEHIEAKLLLTSGEPEVSVFWTDPERDIRIKVRPDRLPGARITADLKTTRSAEITRFGIDSFNKKYHWSAELTTWVLSQALGDLYEDYRFVCLENEPPHDVTIYKVGHDQMVAAREEIQPLLDYYAECYHSGIWPGHPPETRELYWPSWAWRKIRTYDEYYT